MKRIMVLICAAILILLLPGCSKKRSVSGPESPAVTGTYYQSRMDVYDGSNTLINYTISTKTGSKVSTRDYSNIGVPAAHDSMEKTYDANGNITQFIYYDTSTGAKTMKRVYQYQTIVANKYFWSSIYTYDASDVLTGYTLALKSGSSVSARRYDQDGVGEAYNDSLSTYDSNGNLTESIYYDSTNGIMYMRQTYQWQLIAPQKYVKARVNFYDSSNTLVEYTLYTKTASTLAARRYSASDVADPFDEEKMTYDSNGNLTEEIFYNPSTGAQTGKYVFVWEAV